MEYGGIDDLENMNLLHNYCNDIKSLEINFCNRMTQSDIKTTSSLINVTNNNLIDNDHIIIKDLINSQIGLKKIILRIFFF